MLLLYIFLIYHKLLSFIVLSMKKIIYDWNEFSDFETLTEEFYKVNHLYHI
jgi:hypothetical protein